MAYSFAIEFCLDNEGIGNGNVFRNVSGTLCCPAVPVNTACAAVVTLSRLSNDQRYSGLTSFLFGRSTWNSVEPNPTSLIRPFAIPLFPFCIQGVIFAQSTSPSAKRVYPVATCENATACLAISPVLSETAAIGIKLTASSSSRSGSIVDGLTDTQSERVPAKYGLCSSRSRNSTRRGVKRLHPKFVRSISPRFTAKANTWHGSTGLRRKKALVPPEMHGSAQLSLYLE